MFFWTTNAYMSLWMRRTFIFSAGIASLAFLLIYMRIYLAKKREILLLMLVSAVSTFALLIHSNPINGLIGKPHVHPSLLSLLSAISIGLFASNALKKKGLFKGSFYAIVVWAVINLFSWIMLEDMSGRLGFLDSQIIYASLLFGIGIILGLWLYEQSVIKSRFVLAPIAFLIICLLLSQTRSAIVLTAIATLFMFYKHFISKRGLFVVILVVVLGAVLFSGQYFTRLRNTNYLVDSVEYRQQLVFASLPDNKAQLLFGGGVGSIESNIQNNGSNYGLLKSDLGRGVRFESSHNYIVDIVVERGIVVLGFMLALIVIGLIKVYRHPLPENKLLACLLLVTCVYLAVNNINIQMEVIFWVCLVALLSIQAPLKSKVKLSTPKRTAT
jgi:O-antigen ligase